MKENNLKFYSSYPKIPDFFFGNSLHHKDKKDIFKFKHIFFSFRINLDDANG